MGQLLRKLRGALGVAVTWGTVWAAVFLVITGVIAVVHPPSLDEPGDTFLRFALIGAWYGFFSGTVFSALLALFERNRSIAELSLKRVALWGAIATSVWPLVTPVDDGNALIFSPIGAGIAAGLVALARKGRPRGAEHVVEAPSGSV